MAEEVKEEVKEEKKSPSNSGCHLLHEDCDPTLANDVKLPYTAYIVEYTKEGRIAHDIVMTGKESDLFDMYYDSLLYTSQSPLDKRQSRMPSAG